MWQRKSSRFPLYRRACMLRFHAALEVTSTGEAPAAAVLSSFKHNELPLSRGYREPGFGRTVVAVFVVGRTQPVPAFLSTRHSTLSS